MKKLVSVLLAALMLLCCGAAMAEASAPFSFRGGLTWGMTAEEVIAIEGVQPAKTEEYSYHITKLVFEDRQVSNYNCTITYWFVDGGLQQSQITLENTWNYLQYPQPAIIDEMGNALSYAYGEPAAEENADERLTAAFEAITDGLPKSGFDFSINYSKLYTCWMPAENTAIAIAGHDEALFLHYLNVDIDWSNAITEPAPVVTPVPNITGL